MKLPHPMAMVVTPDEQAVTADLMRHLGEEMALRGIAPERAGALVTCMIYLTALEYDDPPATLVAMTKVAMGAMNLAQEGGA